MFLRLAESTLCSAHFRVPDLVKLPGGIGGATVNSLLGCMKIQLQIQVAAVVG